jgi:hypothetical protein
LFQMPCGLPIRDTADYQSALRLFPQKRIALSYGRRIIAINLPVVGKAVCWTET